MALYADACNLFVNQSSDPAAIQHKLDVLREHCHDAGTDFERIRKTLLWTGDPTPTKAFVQELRPLCGDGFQPGPRDAAWGSGGVHRNPRA